MKPIEDFIYYSQDGEDVEVKANTSTHHFKMLTSVLKNTKKYSNPNQETNGENHLFINQKSIIL